MIEDLQMSLFNTPSEPGGVFEEDATAEQRNENSGREPLTYEDFPFDKLNLYGGIDTYVTSGILSKLWPILSQEETMTLPVEVGKAKKVAAPAILESVCSVEMPAHEFILDLEINGLGYSVPRNRFYDKKMEAQIADLDEKIFSSIGKKIDLNSGPAVAKFLYEERGFTPPFFTKGGEPATDGAAIMTLAGLNPIGGKYETKDPALQYLGHMAIRRDISSVRNTFIKTYHTDWVKERTGRIHPSYNLFGTSSFRITGSDPNLTQLPRAKHGYNVRTCYTADPGMVFISFDFSSAEVKVLANMSKEPAMLKAIADGLDFHGYTASAVFGIPYDELMGVLEDKSQSDTPLFKDYKEKRQQSKAVTFGIDIGTYSW